MLRYYITDRHAAGGNLALLRGIERLGDRIDYLQVRERDLAAGDLAALVRAVIRVAHPSVRVLVNDRADVAIACGAHGVHLRGDAVAAERIRTALPPHFQISVSCHGLDEIAGRQDADFLLLAPIFSTRGKGTALGIGILERAARTSARPVLALGGITADRIAPCLLAGAAGIAGISFFQAVL